MLKPLERYVDKNKMEVNAEKSKIVIFKKAGRVKKEDMWKFKGKEIEIVDKYKYLGFWFSTSNTYSKHLKTQGNKAKKTANMTWGIIKRSRIKKLSKKQYLMNTLVKSGFMYGVEIWRWKRREEMEKAQGKCTKLSLRVNENTPGYIWRLESGVRRIEVEARTRAGKCIRRVIQMNNNMWPKI